MNARGSGWLVIGLVSVLSAAALGCAPGAEQPPAETAAETAEPGLEKARTAASVALAIEKEPERADAILKEHGMTLETFQALMVEIAESPELSEAYSAAMESGSTE